VKCGNIASISYRTAGGSAQVLLGEKQQYEPRCRKCYLEGVQAQNNLNTTDKK
jgi:thymidine kinase